MDQGVRRSSLADFRYSRLEKKFAAGFPSSKDVHHPGACDIGEPDMAGCRQADGQDNT